MDEATGAAPTKRCPACRENHGREAFTRGAWKQPGAYCREARAAYERARRGHDGPRYHRLLPDAELERMRAMVACLVCGAIPEPTGNGRVHTDHHPHCSAAEFGTRKTG